MYELITDYVLLSLILLCETLCSDDHFHPFLAEIEMFVQTKGRTKQNVSGAEVKETKLLPEQDRTESKEKLKISAVPDRGKQGALPTIITVLLLCPLVVLVSVGIYLCRRNSGTSHNQSGTILHRSHNSDLVQCDFFERTLNTRTLVLLKWPWGQHKCHTSCHCGSQTSVSPEGGLYSILMSVVKNCLCKP